MTDATGNLHGTGTNGKRLWLRTDDKRWIEIPYGAGEDAKIRSINIWNAEDQCWMTPVWGWRAWNAAGVLGANIDSLEVRAPGRTWLGANDQHSPVPFYNPNYLDRQNTYTFTPMHTGWIRLFHLWPRVDPHWRIVPLHLGLPPQVPNETINYDTTYDTQRVYFWPAWGTRVTSLNLGPQTDYFTAGGSDTPPYSHRAQHEVSLHAGKFALPPTSLVVVATLDLQAIRQWLAEEYPQRGIDYVGQYDDIAYMSVKRIYLHGTVDFHVSQGGHTSANVLEGISGTIYCQPDASVDGHTVEDTASNRVATVGAPATVNPTGDAIYVKYASQLAMATSTSTDSGTGVVSTSYAASITDYVDFKFLPTEDNLTFYARLDGVPQPDGNLISQVTASIDLNISGLSIQYASDGYDVPAALQRWDAIG